MKVELEQKASFDPVFLSIMDTVFMLFYAIGSFFAGILGTIFSGPLIVSIGLFGTAFCMTAFAVLILCDVEKSNNEFMRTFLPLVS
jgi:sugar phosphate permease